MNALALRKGGRRLICLLLFTIIFVMAAAILKYRKGEINYYNSDAAWHTLLTVEAYRETPVSEHLFLPIVSLGSQDDKWIPWGATIPDERGNFYYTSFSPAGYFLPWLFMKIFGLPVTEESLYLFNSVLFAVSALLWVWFISMIYEESRAVTAIALTALFTYVLSPELLHGMGVAYWHQSVMQVTLLLQIIAWFGYKEKGLKAAKIIFYGMALLNPYIEWTGYVANVGFAIAELFGGGKGQWKKAFGKAATLGVITAASFGLFAGHYLLRVDRGTFLDALQSRFMARNVTTDTTLAEVLKGYIQSFGFWWTVLLLLIIGNIVMKRKIVLRHGLLMFVMTFPLLENVLMKQHAVEYTYDRMKGIFILSFLICELSCSLIKDGKRKLTAAGLLVLTAAAGLLNFQSYRNSSGYIWEAGYRADNEKIAAFINQEYPDCVLAMEDHAVRGYMNLLFGRGIYEFTPADSAKEIAAEKGKRYAVILNVEDSGAWNVYELAGAVVYDLDAGETELISMQEGNVILQK